MTALRHLVNNLLCSRLYPQLRLTLFYNSNVYKLSYTTSFPPGCTVSSLKLNEIKTNDIHLCGLYTSVPALSFMYLIFLIYHRPEKATQEAINSLLIPNNSDYMDE